MERRNRYRALLAAIVLALVLQPIAASGAVFSRAKTASPAYTAAQRVVDGQTARALASATGSVSPMAADDVFPGIALPPSPVTGVTLNEDTDFEDMYKVTLAAGQKIVFRLTGPAGTYFGLDLYGPGSTGWVDGEPVTGAWSGEDYPYFGSYIVPVGKGGQYCLDVYSMGGSGNYTIEYAITTAEANDLFPGVALTASPVSGELDVVADNRDIYSVSLAAGKKFSYSINGEPGTSFSGALLGSSNEDDVRAWAWDEAYPFTDSYVVPMGKGGTYYLVMYAEEGVGDYTITYTITDADPDDYIPGIVLPASPATGDLGTAGDEYDVYRVALLQGQRITASLTTATAAPSDFDLLVLGPGATDVYNDEPLKWAAGETYPEVISFTAPAAGTYYLAVSAYTGADDYQLTYSIAMAPPTTYTKVQGANRYTTAVAASQRAFPAGGAPCVVIATGANWPDALGGAALAAAKGGPILLTDPARLPAEVKTEIKRLGATEAIILGSETAVSRGVFREVDALVGTVTRIGGTNRYNTADQIARKVKALTGKDFEGTCFIATGSNFPDALGASPISAAYRWPILLVSPNGLTSETKKTIADLDVWDIKVLGSSDAVPSSVFEALSPLGVGGERIEGRNRYETATKVAAYGVRELGMTYDKLAIATGENFPDALAAGVMQGKDGSVMLLTPRARLDGYAQSALKTNKWGIDNVRYMGSTSAVSSTVRAAVQALMK